MRLKVGPAQRKFFSSNLHTRLDRMRAPPRSPPPPHPSIFESSLPSFCPPATSPHAQPPITQGSEDDATLAPPPSPGLAPSDRKTIGGGSHALLRPVALPPACEIAPQLPWPLPTPPAESHSAPSCPPPTLHFCPPPLKPALPPSN